MKEYQATDFKNQKYTINASSNNNQIIGTIGVVYIVNYYRLKDIFNHNFLTCVKAEI